MLQLRSAITIVEIIVSVVLVLIAGDYLGYKVGRTKLAIIAGGVGLLSMVIFAIFAAFVLATR
jgi:hypothetical protein